MQAEKLFTQYKLQLLGIMVGLMAGYLYYNQIGCVTGTCAITSNPWLSTAYGGAVGYFIAGIFADRRKPQFRNEE